MSAAGDSAGARGGNFHINMQYTDRSIPRLPQQQSCSAAQGSKAEELGRLLHGHWLGLVSGCGQPRDDPACHWGMENRVGGLRDDRRSFWAEQQVKKNGSKNAVLFLMKPLD